MPTSLLRRASALNFFSASKANLASWPFCRSSNWPMQLSRLMFAASAAFANRHRRFSKSNQRAPQECDHKHQGTAAWLGGMRKGLPFWALLAHEAAKFSLLPTVPDSPMNRRRKIYEGKAKILFEGPEPG